MKNNKPKILLILRGINLMLVIYNEYYLLFERRKRVKYRNKHSFHHQIQYINSHDDSIGFCTLSETMHENRKLRASKIVTEFPLEMHTMHSECINSPRHISFQLSRIVDT